MARAHLFRPITDREGNLLYNATVTVREVDYSIPVGQPLYAGPEGTEELPNPFTAVNGVIDLWLETPQRMSVLVQHEQVSDILVYLDAHPAPEEVVSSSVPLEIVNEPTTSGQVLLSTSTAGQAQWGNPPSGTGLTPVVVVSSQNFTTGFDPVNWSFVETNGADHEYDPLTIPPGTNYQYALKLTQSADGGSATVTGPTFTLLEPGRMSLWLRSAFAAGESAAIKVTSSAAVQTTLTTISETRDWGFYAFDLEPGTWTPIIEYTGPAPLPAGEHALWITGYVAQYGGAVPPHNHNGSGTDSVALGTGATAPATGATAVGASADATGTNASAFGYNATAAGISSLAVGYNASAPTDYSMAVGSGATGDAAAPAWVALGYGANAGGEESVAVGRNATVQADFATAVGTGAQVGINGVSAVAIGQNAQALGANSVAIGQGAVVGAAHNNSVALGAQATTTSANQIMLGNPGAITTITGSLQNYGIASLGSPDSRIGFYGSAGNIQQVVAGSDDGNVTLRTLVQALAAMGLIVNQTTEQPAAFKNPVGVIDYFYHQDPGDGTWGSADFDFLPYTYRPLAFSDVPYPSGPQFFVGSDHNGYKGYAGGLGALKNMYNPRHTFVFSTTTSGTGNKICFAIRHTGEEGDDAACGYVILDQAAGTVSVATKAAGDPSNVYSVAAGNSIGLASINSTPFDGTAHSILVSVSGSWVMYCDLTSNIPAFFHVPALNLSGTYIGIDVNKTETKIHNIFFLPPHSFDGFRTTGALSNAPSSEAWWPVTSGAGSSVTVSASGNLQATGVAGGYALAYIVTGANSSGKNVRTRWSSSVTPTTAMGIVGRYVDANNYYFINNSQITRVLNGTQTTLATLSQTFAAGDSILVSFWSSGQIVVQRNNVTIGSAVDTTASLLASNRFGLGVRGAATAGFQYFWCYDNYTTAVTYK